MIKLPQKNKKKVTALKQEAENRQKKKTNQDIQHQPPLKRTADGASEATALPGHCTPVYKALPKMRWGGN